MTRISALFALLLLLVLPLHAEVEIKIALGHAGDIEGIAYSPDGKRVVTASLDRYLKIWETSSGRELRSMGGSNIFFRAVAWSPDGKTIASGDGGAVLKLWDAGTGELIRPLGNSEHQTFALVYLPDGKRILTGDEDGTLSVRSIQTGKEEMKVRVTNKPVYTVAVSPDGRYAASGGDDWLVRIFDLRGGRLLRTLAGHTREVKCVSFSPDGKRLLSSSYDGSIAIWDAETGTRLRELRSPGTNLCRSAFWSKDGKKVISVSINGKLLIRDAETGKDLAIVQGQYGYYTSLALGPDESKALSGGGDGALTEWDLVGGYQSRRWNSVKGKVKAARFSPDGYSVLAGLTDKSLRLWDVRLGRLLKTMNGHAGDVMDVRFLPDGSKALSGSRDRTVKLWELASGKALLTLNGHTRDVLSLGVSRDGKTGASGGFDRMVHLWDLTIGKEILSFGDTNDRSLVFGGINTVRFSSDGKTILTSSDDFTVRTWDSETGAQKTLMRHLSHAYCATWLPGEKQIVSGGYSDNIRVWNSATGSQAAVLPLQAGGNADIAFAPDGKTFLSSGGASSALWISRYPDGTPLLKPVGHLGRIRSVEISPGGNRALTGSDDGTFRIWDYSTGKLIASFVADGSGDWLVWTPDGYFEGTDTAVKTLVYLTDGVQTWAIDQFTERYRRPDIIAARLQGLDTSKAAVSDLSKGFSRPPSVTVSLRKAEGTFSIPALPALLTEGTNSFGWLVSNGNALVRVHAFDNGGGIDGVRLFVNGKAVGEDVRGISVKQKTENGWYRDFIIPLGEGDNRIEAVGFSSDRTESSPFPVLVKYSTPRVVKPRLFVVAAAADVYRNPQYNLNFALADAKGFVSALRPAASKIFGEISVAEVYGANLTKDSLRAALEGVKARSVPGDVFVFFYAGHGIALPVEGKTGDFFFVLPGVTVMNDPDKLRSEGLGTSEFRDLVAAIPAGKQLMLVDACNSGAFLDGYDVRGAAEENALAQLQRSSGMALFSASTGEQFANEVKDLGHGLFTWALMQGLSGEAAAKDGKITAATLKSYIDDAVPLLAKKYRGSEQFPLARVSGQDFPLGVK